MNKTIQEAILNIMEEHNGYQKALKRTELRLKLIEQWGTINDTEMRLIVQEMANNGVLIGSHQGYGYFMVETEADLNKAVNSLKSKAYSLFRRASRLNEAYCAKTSELKQLEWNFTKEGVK